MNNVTCFIMTTTNPHRWTMLIKALNLIDNQNIFIHKILFIDKINDHELPDDLKNKFTTNGWNLIFGEFCGRAKSMANVLQTIATDWIFYSEDDILNYFPKDINSIFNTINEKIIQNKKCGWLTFNMSGSIYNCAKKIDGDLKFYNLNKIIESDEYIVFKRMECLASAWFFSFPSIFIKKEIFQKCNDYAIKNLRGNQIEIGLTKAYFKLQLDKKYYKLSIAKKTGLKQLINFNNVKDFEYSYIDLLDLNQGNNIYNSFSHNY